MTGVSRILVPCLLAAVIAVGGLGRLCAAQETASADDGIFSSMFSDNFRVSGGNLRYIPDSKAILIRDYATILLRGRTPNEWRRIRARNIIFFTERNKVYAEGDVSIEDDSGTFINCDRFYFDNSLFRGRALNVRMRSTDEGHNRTESVEETDVSLTRPTLHGQSGGPLDRIGEYEQEQRLRMNVVTPDLRLISKDHYEATDVTASPSNYARPHWGIYSKAVHMRRGEKVEAYHNLVKIGKVPVFYLPYVIYDLQYRWPYYRTSIDNNNRQGFSWFNRIGWVFRHPTDENGKPVKQIFRMDEIYADVDMRLKRGWGVGGELTYSSESALGTGEGHLRGYWINETYTKNGEDWRRSREDNEYRGNDWGNNPNYSPALYANKDRYMVEWWHRQRFNDNFDLRMQTHWFSDRDFYKEYFRNEWVEQQDKRTNASLRYIGDLFQTEMVVQGRLNDFRTETEYMPEWRFNLPGVKLGPLPLYVDSSTRAGLIRKRSDKMLDQLSLITPADRTENDGQTPWIGRVHNQTEISMPLDLGPVTVRPYAGGFLSGYSTGYNGNYGRTSDGKFNAAGLWGVDTSSRFFGYFRNETLRHMVEPTIRVYGRESPVTNRIDLFNVDEVDNYRKSHRTDFSLYQDLQYKGADGVKRTLASLDLSTGLIMSQKEADEFNRGNILSDTTATLRINPLRELSLWGSVIYSPANQKMDYFTVGGDYWFSKRLRMFLHHQYSASTPGASNTSNLTTLALRTQLWNRHSHYSLEYALGYEWNNDAAGVVTSDGMVRGRVAKGLQSQKISLIRDLDTVQIGVSWMVDHTNNNNNSISVNLMPKGWIGERRLTDNSYVSLDSNYGRYANPVAEKQQAQDPAYNAATPAWQ